MIKLCDKLQIEIHFLRFLHLALFESRPPIIFDWEHAIDIFGLVFIITPLFITGLRYFTAPVYLNYRLKINAVVLPLAVPYLYLATHWDILLLTVLVSYMNFHPFWYHMDPPSHVYLNGQNYRQRPRRQRS